MNSPSPPDWSKVHFPVTCARCGHDLFGQEDPICPACNLEFDWSEAVPLDKLKCSQCSYPLMGLTSNRCPECGEPFTWQEALAAHHRSKYPLFEHQWRKRFFRSWFTSWRWALRPKRLWQQVNIHDNPPVGGLITLMLVVLLQLGLVVAIVDIAYLVYQVMRWPRLAFWRNVPGALLFTLSSLWGVILWMIFFLGAMLVYRQSMRQIRVRNQHVLRIWVYTICLVMPTYIGVCIICERISRYRLFLGGGFAATPTLEERIIRAFMGFAFFLMIAHVFWGIRCGYRYYLKMDHAIGIAIAAIVMSGLATAVAMSLHVWF